MRNILFTFALILLPLSLVAQEGNREFPKYTSTYVNDFADFLPADTRSRITEKMYDLRTEHGIEMTVATFSSRHDYGDHGSLERFATGLFNQWGVGNADRNDGILLLVLHKDREMRIELGAGYGREYDWAAQQVIDDFILPSFRKDEYAVGIEAGVNATIREIALVKAEGGEPAKEGMDLVAWAISAGFFVFMVLLMFRRTIGDMIASLYACPNCSGRGLRRTRQVIKAATETLPGKGILTTKCNFCDFRDDSDYTISPTKSHNSSSSSFGGGSSSGGGASGRW
ncbi:hypothetical protein RB2150_03479 [Rhodobacterales bacterium HTCC2150]|nr:hypothetical protein RB2150_03479 [Rhodobacterales bacterium HTCC2150] [Rhodobacteraceae bacterium HTCC2150]